jgi:hypothetical protein
MPKDLQVAGQNLVGRNIVDEPVLLEPSLTPVIDARMTEQDLAGVSSDPEQATPLPTSCRSLSSTCRKLWLRRSRGTHEDSNSWKMETRFLYAMINYVTKGEEEENKWLKMREVPETKQCDSLLQAFC